MPLLALPNTSIKFQVVLVRTVNQRALLFAVNTLPKEFLFATVSLAALMTSGSLMVPAPLSIS